MKILKFLTERFGKDNDEVRIDMQISLLKSEIEECSYYSLRNEVVKKIVEELHPEIKSKLLEKDGFEKVINEVRLEIAKKVLND